MKTLMKVRPEPGATLSTVDDLKIKADELLIKVHRASICGSDLPIYNWNSWAPKRFKTPSSFGHEFCGTIAGVGREVKDFKKNDFVSVESHIYCGVCQQCTNGQRHVCREMKIIGVDGPGGFGDYAVIPARCAWKHTDHTLKDFGSLFEPFGNAVYSVLVEPVKDKTVLVMGCGPQGLFSIAVAKASGASLIVAVEGSKYRADLARRLGADSVIDPNTSDALDQLLRDKRVKDGFDVVCEMSGAAPAIGLAFKAVRMGGRISAFGIPSQKIEINWAGDLIFRGVRVFGIVGREIFKTWELTDQLLRSKTVDIKPVITHTFPLSDYAEGFSVMNSPKKECGKVVFIP